jgi:fatty-acyl-CoA synthase
MTLLEMLADAARRDPDAAAAIDASPERPLTLSRGELLDRTLGLRADMARAGVGRGDCVAVWLPNWSDALAWQFATAALGAHVIGVNTRYNTAMAALAGGATCLLKPVFDADAVLADMATFGVTHAVGGDDMLGRITDAWHRSPTPLPSWRSGSWCSRPVPP